MKKPKSIDEWEYSNINWMKVLDTIWKYAPNRYGRGKTGYEDEHPLAIKLKIEPHDLMLIMSFLEEQMLIEYDELRSEFRPFLRKAQGLPRRVSLMF